MAAGANAPRALLEHAIATVGSHANEWAASLPVGDPAAADVAVRALIRAHVKIARYQGAALGAALTGLELTPLLGPAGELPAGAAAIGAAADVVTLAWIQARLVLHVAAAYGHDAADADARLGDLASFFGVAELLGGAGYAAVGAVHRVGGRVPIRRLRHEPAAAVKAVARMAGMRLTPRRLLDLLPVVNVPLLVSSNGRVVRNLGTRARSHYRSLPVPTRQP